MYIAYQLKCLCSHIFLFSDYLFAFFFFVNTRVGLGAGGSNFTDKRSQGRLKAKQDVVSLHSL